MRGARILGITVFILELASLLYLSILFLVLLAYVTSRGPYDSRLLLLGGGAYGLFSLWWMLTVVGPPGRTGPYRIPAAVLIGVGVGVLVAAYFLVTLLPSNRIGLDLQGLALFGAPVATAVHLLVRLRKRNRTS